MNSEPVKSLAVPELRLRIGVTGHRNLAKLSVEATAKVRERIDEILRRIADGARARSQAKSQLVVISCLAEGADRLVATAGLALGYGLEAVLPFARAEYARDFVSPESVDCFTTLIEKCDAVFELDGNPAARPHAYESAGYVLVSNIDALVAIWDGEDSDARGGTAEVVKRAVTEGIPVAWIDPLERDGFAVSGFADITDPLTFARLRNAFQQVGATQLETALWDRLTPSLGKSAEKSLVAFATEFDSRNVSAWYSAFLRVSSLGLLRVRPVSLEESLSDTRREWASYFSMVPADKSQRPAMEKVLLPAFAKADRLAVHYASAYRGTYTTNFALAGLAVVLALVGGLFFKSLGAKSVFVAGETLIAFLIVYSWLSGHRNEWHRRWLEYRRIAECLRQIRILAPLGLGGPIRRSAGHFDLARQDWANWYVHSVRRLIPLAHMAVDRQFLAAVRDSVTGPHRVVRLEC